MNDNNDNKVINIMLIEDNPGDADLVLEAFGGCSRVDRINIFKTGEEAIDFLKNRCDSHGIDGLPDFIILDLNLPGKSGFEVLNEIKQSERLKLIPVIILSSSSSDRDVIKSYDMHANCYITKPVTFDNFLEIAKTIEKFWFELSKLPVNVDLNRKVTS